MQKNTRFSCDICNEKVSISELFKMNKNSITTCKNCKTQLFPKNPISFQWAFFIGFALTVIPAEITIYLSNNLFDGFIAALLGGALAISGIVGYTYLTTEFSS
jgi:hypothetical protein